MCGHSRRGVDFKKPRAAFINHEVRASDITQPKRREDRVRCAAHFMRDAFVERRVKHIACVVAEILRLIVVVLNRRNDFDNRQHLTVDDADGHFATLDELFRHEELALHFKVRACFCNLFIAAANPQVHA